MNIPETFAERKNAEEGIKKLLEKNHKKQPENLASKIAKKEYLLVILKPKDEKHYLFHKFLKSLPKGAEVRLHSGGAGMELSEYLRTGKPKNVRTFLLFQVDKFNDDALNKEYFYKIDRAALLYVNELKVKRGYLIHHSFPRDQFVYREFYNAGSIDEMVDLFLNLKGKDHGSLLIKDAIEDSAFRRMATKKRLRGGRKFYFTRVAVGLHTLDDKYMIQVSHPIDYKNGKLHIKD